MREKNVSEKKLQIPKLFGPLRIFTCLVAIKDSIFRCKTKQNSAQIFLCDEINGNH